MLPSFLEQLDPSVYMSDNYLVVDFETDTSAGPQHYGHARMPENQLLLACYRDSVGPVQACWGNELQQQHLLDHIAAADFIVAHQAKYELGWFKRMGVDLHKVLVFDTLLAEYVLLGNLAAGSNELGMRRHPLNLEACCIRRGLQQKDPVVDTMIKNGINPVDIPRAWLQGRCEQDVVTTEQVFLSQRIELQRRGLLPVLFTRCLLTPVLADIEQEGMAVDGEAVQVEHAKYEAQRNELQAKMDAFTGGINTRSPAQMGHFLYGPPSEGGLGFAELADRRGNPRRNAPTKQFPAGAPLTDQKSIDKLTARTKRQEEFVELHFALAKANAMLSKTLSFLRGVAEEYGGQFFGEIHQANTATQRTSSTGVRLEFKKQADEDGTPLSCSLQFQNFPRILKKLLKAKRPGWLMAEPDGSQIEFRCAALLGNDQQAIADICDPTFDAHLVTASKIYDCSIEDVKRQKIEAAAKGEDDWRQLSKPDTYKPLYGGKYGSPGQERYYKWFREHYKGISKAQHDWVETALDTKRQVTPWGLTYYWPFAKRSANGSVNCETNVDNYPIQALATAEIVPIAVVYLWHRIAEAGLEDLVRIVNMVHDSAPCEVAPQAVVVQKFIALVKQCFTADVYHYLRHVYGMNFDKVPLGVGLKVGTHWGTGQEQSWDIYSNGNEVKRK